MVIGNFVLLAELVPDEVHRWYLGVCVDTFEWVEPPNTVGVSQWADGGRIATKLHVGSATYFSYMSDYCKGYHYDSKQHVGEHTYPHDALYWDFSTRHSEVFGRNSRLSMMCRQLAKMEPEKRDTLRRHAEEMRAGLEAL